MTLQYEFTYKIVSFYRTGIMVNGPFWGFWLLASVWARFPRHHRSVEVNVKWVLGAAAYFARLLAY